MYELIVLALLMHGPWHGYRIAKITNDIIGPWASVSQGTLYPVLARLEEAGYIGAVDDGSAATPSRGRRSRVYAITPGGRMRFHQLMIDTTSNLGDYRRLFYLKVPYLEWLAPEERLHLCDHFINYCEAAVLYLDAEARDLLHVQASGQAVSPHFVAAAVDLMRHQASQWRADAAWARRLRERYRTCGMTADTRYDLEGGEGGSR